MNNPPEKMIIACRSLKPEIDALLTKDNTGAEAVAVEYLDQNLHRTPHAMPDIIQASVEAVPESVSTIVLGYGLCSNGIVGIKAPRQGLIIPRVHDCIALFLGSRQAYHAAFKKRAGTYYLTPGWIAEEKDPIGFMENDYEPRLGREEAEWGAKEELQHYTHIIFINTRAVDDPAPLRERARENANFFDKQYEEVQGVQNYFQKIVFGPYDEDDFLHVRPGETVTQKPFLDM
ncbi:MAG: DUF1638 domain-containing protein [Thermodesulfobacteriota bacterium]|nr:DUF1638 domain-containing protein [Thermodesulfobacteriota bacterium]